MKALVILNPSADRGRAYEKRHQLISGEWAEWQVDLELTKEPGHAVDLALRGVNAGYQRIVAAGGDGTIHEIVNGIVATGSSAASLGVIPIGSGNDFAYGVGASFELKEAVARSLMGEVSWIDLARINTDRGHSLMADNAVGIGFDATISIESRRIQRLHGFAAYTLATLRTIAFHYDSPRFELSFDDELVAQEALLLAIGLGPRVGGGFLLTPGASHQDALLDSCLIQPMGRLAMLGILPRVMRGTHISSEKVETRKSRHIRLKSSMPVPIHVDGEIIATVADGVFELNVQCVPRAIRVAV